MGFDSSWSTENGRFNWISRVFTSWQVLSDFRQSQHQLLKCYTSERQLVDEDKTEHKRSDKVRQTPMLCCTTCPICWRVVKLSAVTEPNSNTSSPASRPWNRRCIQWCTDMDHVNVHPVMYWHGVCQHASINIPRWNMSTHTQWCTDMDHVNMHPSTYRDGTRQHTQWCTGMDHVNTHVTYWHGWCQRTSSDILRWNMSTHTQWCTDTDDVNIHPAELCTGKDHINMHLVIYWHGSVSYTHLTLPTNHRV